MCLSEIAAHSVSYQDQEFVDPIDKKKYIYAARVYTGTIRLASSIRPNSVNSVSCSIWFQDELPFPGVDLSKLKPKLMDSYPLPVKDGLI